MKYAKLIDNKLEFAPRNKGSILNYDLDEALMTADGYKQFIECEKPQTDRYFHIEYNETKNKISENIIWDETPQEYEQRIELEHKIQRNEDIDNKVGELEQFAILEMVRGNDCNVLTIKSIINSLKDAKFDI